MAEKGAAAPYLRQGQDHKAGQRHLHINWSNFKPEFSGKPEEDAEAHLLHSNDWMNAHHFNNLMSSKILSYTARRSKIVVPFFRTLRRNTMGSTTEFIQTKVLKIR